MPPGPPPAHPPIALHYSKTAANRPGLITAFAIIGIGIALLGLIVAAFGGLAAVAMAAMTGAMPNMGWQTSGAVIASICEAVTGAALAIILLTGSIALLCLRQWSRTILLWWASLYLLSVFLFLILRIVVVLPSQMAIFTNTVVTTMPATGTSASTTTFTYVNSNNGGGGMTTATATGGPPPPQDIAFIKLTYIIADTVKAFMCLIFPIATLIVLRTKIVRVAFVSESIQANNGRQQSQGY